jgi:hypothetical protein
MNLAHRGCSAGALRAMAMTNAIKAAVNWVIGFIVNSHSLTKSEVNCYEKSSFRP